MPRRSRPPAVRASPWLSRALSACVALAVCRLWAASRLGDAFFTGPWAGTSQRRATAAAAAGEAAGSLGLAHVLVEADAPTKASVHPCAAACSEEGVELRDGEVLVHIAKVVFTANTLTYAMAGKYGGLRYFDHFPVPEDVPDAQRYARSPAWGTGVVTASRCAGVKEGTRIHGLFPMSPSVVLRPVNGTGASFVDGASHRAGLISSYNTYRTKEDTAYKGVSSKDEEDFQVAVRGLFSTGWSMCQSALADPSAPTAIVLTSASSRTAYSAAFAAKLDGGKVRVLGVTSPQNEAFVRGLGVYDEVAVYGDEASLTKQRAAVFDLAGNAAVLQAIYKHFGEDVVSCGMVGATHVNANAMGAQAAVETFGGVAPAPFLIFTAIQKLQEVHGVEGVESMLFEAAAAYKDKMMPSFEVVRKNGAEETLQAYQEMVRGSAKPNVLTVCSLWPPAQEEPSL